MLDIKKELKQYDKNEFITKEIIIKILKSKNYKKYYEYLNNIYYTLNNIKKPNLNHILSDLLEFNKQFEIYYNTIKNNEYRINSLNSYYKLLRALDWCKYSYDKCNINLLKTESKLYEHERIFKKICVLANWDYNNFSKIN